MTSCPTDSGTETLFSENESLCEVNLNEDNDDVGSLGILGPPNIQPYSGILVKDKVLIRPIAYKPTVPRMTPSAKCNDRYGSTPILASQSPKSSSYSAAKHLFRCSNLDNCSLSRKPLSSCTSPDNPSPPLAMTSLPSIPHTHKLLDYDSLESVRKSPNNGKADCGKSSYRRSSSNIGSILDRTPSPSDSGVSELEAALRDRDSELAFLRQTMEHNEQVIFRVYQEKEKIWERELQKLKVVYDSRMRASEERASKMEQMLMMQTYQHNQDKRRLIGEVNDLRSRLEETEWSLCQKTGEIALLKTQLKECQQENTTKCQELLQLRTDLRDLQQQFHNLDQQKSPENLQLEVESLRSQLRKYESMESINKNGLENVMETEGLKAEIEELRKELSELSIYDYSRNVSTRLKAEVKQEELINSENNTKDEMGLLKSELVAKNREFNREKLIWAQEKEKVLRYQRQLQMNYVQMYRRNKVLQQEINDLTLKLTLEKSVSDENQTAHLTSSIHL